MTPGLRKFALASHVTSSVGWLGAVAGFLALAVAGLSNQNAETVRAAYIAMHLTTWFVIVPLSLAALLTGLVQSLGTTWGLFRHYWIVTKLLLTVLATIILLVHTQPIDRVAAVAGGAQNLVVAARGEPHVKAASHRSERLRGPRREVSENSERSQRCPRLR